VRSLIWTLQEFWRSGFKEENSLRKRKDETARGSGFLAKPGATKIPTRSGVVATRGTERTPTNSAVRGGARGDEERKGGTETKTQQVLHSPDASEEEGERRRHDEERNLSKTRLLLTK